MVTDVSKRVDACKQFFLLEVTARIVAAFLEVLGMSDVDDEIPGDMLPANVQNGSKQVKKEYFDNLCAKVVDQFIMQKERRKDIMKKQAYEDWKKVSNGKTDEGRYLCRFKGCGQTFRDDGKRRLDHERSHGLHKQLEENRKSLKSADDMLNYQRSVLDYGLIVHNFYDAISEGDGMRLIRCWKFILPYLQNDGQRSRKYALEALYLICQIEALLSPQDAHSIIWNRFHKAKSGYGGNIPLDLMLEHYNNFMKNVVRLLGPNNTNRKAIDRFAKASTVNKKLIENFDSICRNFRRSGKHSQASHQKDLKKIVANLMTHKAMTYTAERKYQKFHGMRHSLLDDFDLHSMYSWIESHKKNILTKRASR